MPDEQINIFISYADEDERFKKQLETHLAPLKRDGTIRLLYNQQVKGYQERRSEIAKIAAERRWSGMIVMVAICVQEKLDEAACVYWPLSDCIVF